MRESRPTPQPSLATLLAVDVGSGVVASLAVAPFIMAIDRAIIEAAAGTTTLASAIVKGATDMVKRPRTALLLNPGYWMVATVYGVTYAAANSIDTVGARWETPAAVQGAATLVGTTAINTSACIAKDVAFTRMYGNAAASGSKFPLATIGLFGLRDLMTIASAFTLPKLLSSFLVSSRLLPDPSVADVAAQMASPVGAQVVCAPIHLLALNFYNMPSASAAERAAAVWALTPATTVAYAIRIAPAFGIGGVLNTALSGHGRDAIRAHYCPGVDEAASSAASSGGGAR